MTDTLTEAKPTTTNDITANQARTAVDAARIKADEINTKMDIAIVDVGANDQADAVGRPTEVGHSLGKRGELPGFTTSGVHYPYLPNATIGDSGDSKEGQARAVGREPGSGVGPALGELALSAAVEVNHDQPGQRLDGAVLLPFHPTPGIRQAASVRG